MHNRRGGAGRGQGARPGSKNAQKAPQDRHSVKQFVSYTPEEFERVTAAMTALHMNHAQFARLAALEKAANIEGEHA